MTLIVAHRRNSLSELGATPSHLGVEMDVRTRHDDLVVTHDAFGEGVPLERWLDHYDHALLVVNVKEEGLERLVEPLLAERGIAAWTYLDQSVPFLVRTLARGETRCAVRVSEYESAPAALALTTRPQWVWLDSFTGPWVDEATLQGLAGAGVRIMVVSPELHGRAPEAEVELLRARFTEAGVTPDAVCTKRPELWS